MRVAGIVSLLVAAFLLFSCGSLIYQDNAAQKHDWAQMRAGDTPEMQMEIIGRGADDGVAHNTQSFMDFVAGSAFLVAGLALVLRKKPA